VESGADALGLQRRGRAGLNLGAAHLAELAAEIAPLVRDATLSEIVALPPRDVVLYFRGESNAAGRALVRRVHVSADGDAPRLYLQTARQVRPDGPVGPFFRRLVEELSGARLRRLEPAGGDRIVALEFDGTPRGERRTLVAELFGRHANLILLGGGDRVLDVLVPPPADTKNAARLELGVVWTPPGGAPKTAKEAHGLAQMLAGPEIASEAKPDPLAPLSFLVQERLGREVAELALARARRTLVERVQRKLERARSLEKGLEQRLAASSDAERVRLDGEALKVHLHEVARGAKEVVLVDPFDASGATRRIELDPRRGPRENVEWLFERYRKLLRAQESVAEELAGCRAKVAALERLLTDADGPDPEAVDARAVAAGLLDPRQEADERKRAAPEPRKPYRSFRGSKGSEIRVGRSAKDNDELSLHHCRGNDVWLHTASAPGSHVVLCVEKNAEPDSDEVLDAAHLAAHFSPLREARRVDVHVARCKDVHKPRGAKPGLVTLSGGKVLTVRVQPERLARLLEPPAPPVPPSC
jgi:predicted ribosome quality control (RQC) complex YloA/Tae2 family protein